MTRAIALVPFAYAEGGTNTRQVQKDEVLELPDGVFNGLKASGKVKESADGQVVDAPRSAAEPNWDGVGDKELVAMIKSRTGEDVIAGRMSHAQLLAAAQHAWKQEKRETKKPGPDDPVAAADARRTAEIAESSSGNPMNQANPERQAFGNPQPKDTPSAADRNTKPKSGHR